MSQYLHGMILVWTVVSCSRTSRRRYIPAKEALATEYGLVDIRPTLLAPKTRTATSGATMDMGWIHEQAPQKDERKRTCGLQHVGPNRDNVKIGEILKAVTEMGAVQEPCSLNNNYPICARRIAIVAEEVLGDKAGRKMNLRSIGARWTYIATTTRYAQNRTTRITRDSESLSPLLPECRKNCQWRYIMRIMQTLKTSSQGIATRMIRRMSKYHHRWG